MLLLDPNNKKYWKKKYDGIAVLDCDFHIEQMFHYIMHYSSLFHYAH